jgi:hypothetical protein
MCFAERQRFARIGDNSAGDRYDDAAGVTLDRDRMIGAGDFDRLCFCLDGLFHWGSPLAVELSGDYVADLPPSTKST